MRFLPILLAVTVFAASAVPSNAGGKKHQAQPSVQALHLMRLAAKEKKEWRDHLAKLRALPRPERIAEKRREKLWQRKHDAKVAAMQAAAAAKAAAKQAAVAKLQAAQQRQAKAARRQAKAAHRHPHAPAAIAAAPKNTIKKISVSSRRPVAHSAAPSMAQTRQTAHARNLAVQAAAHQENVAHAQAVLAKKAAQRQALRALHLTNVQAAYRAHLANVQAARNAHIAAERAHWIALHGDGSGGPSIRFWQTAAAGVPVKVISVDLNNPDVKVSAVMARRGNGTSEPFQQMIERANPNVAVTGTFFSLDDLQPIGDIVIDGSLVHFGGMGTALCITPGNRAEMVTCQWGRHHDWSPYDFVVACGPRLLQDGRVVLDATAERFHDRHMLAPNSRIAVGFTQGNTLIFVMTHEPIYLGRLARVMQSLGASEAMNLDAGSSTGFYYNGATLARPGRRLTNMIVVYGHRDRYERALDQLIPAAYHRTATRYRRQISEASPSSSSRPATLAQP